MQKVQFVVKNRPTKTTDGRTDVVLMVKGKDGAKDTITPLGYILKTRGQDEYRGYTAEDTEVGSFGSRSQAGHAIQRAVEGREKRGISA